MKKILIIDDDPVIRKLVSGLLIRENYQVLEATHGKEGLSQFSTSPPDLIISDVLMPEMDGYEFCEKIRSTPQGKLIPIMLLTALDSVEQKIKGFEVGADDYLVKPFEPQEFLVRIAALLRRRETVPQIETAQGKAKTIGVFSLRGGAGVSSIAANLAIGLSQIWQLPTALVDLVLVAGQSALFLNQPLKNTWAEIAKAPLDEIDDQLVLSALLPHDSGLKTLASPKRPMEGELLNSEMVSRVISILRQVNEYVVIDFPHNFSGTTLAGIDLTDLIIIVIQPEIASLRSAAIALDTFGNLGYNKENLKIVLNWTFPRLGINNEDIEKYIKRGVDITLPYASDELIKGINFGNPPAYVNPNETMGAIFEDLAMAISKQEHRQNKPEQPSDAWTRVLDRYKQRKRK
ncbi:MAG: response regulator [Anaerolineales bacterium]|nr:response regulator [Anaerolineales bacterium]